MNKAILNDLQDKDCVKAHALFQKMLVESATLDIYYDIFLKLIHSKELQVTD